jgi:hypothetical protein
MRILMILLVCKMHWKLTLNVRLEGKQGPEQSKRTSLVKIVIEFCIQSNVFAEGKFKRGFIFEVSFSYLQKLRKKHCHTSQL